MGHSKKQTLLLVARGLEWRIVEPARSGPHERGERVVVAFSQAEYARMWLRDLGYTRTAISMSSAELWEKDGKQGPKGAKELSDEN